MRTPLAAVLTVAFVFASGAFLAHDVAGQIGSASLSGQVCAAYPEPYPMESAGAASNEGSCYMSPLPGAAVRLTRPLVPPVNAFDRSVQADQEGRFSFQDLQEGTYHVAVSRAGFVAAASDVEVRGASHASFVLAPQDVTARGTVRSSEGLAPIAGAEIHFCCPSYPPLVTTTDAGGSFEATVKAGSYSLTVRAPGFIEAYDYRLVDGAASLDFVLEPLPDQDAVLSGTVRDQNGDPVPGARVFASTSCCPPGPEPGPSPYPASTSSPEPMPKDPASSYSPYYGYENWTTTDASGRYRIDVYSGTLNLRVEKEGHALAYDSAEVRPGESATHDLEVLKIPAKTARLVGRVVDEASGSPLPHPYLSARSPLFGIYECSAPADAPVEGDAPAGSEPAIAIARPMPYPGDAGCAITLHADGTFEGLLTPGYTILNVGYDSYASCTRVRDDDGDIQEECGPEYLGWSRTLTLPADATTEITVALRARAEPDAVVEGYLLDAETGQAIPDAQLYFSNQDNYGWGSATTDEDGSYRIRVRSGYHTVSSYADGYLPWEGTVDIRTGERTPFDVLLTPGRESYGGCCPTYPGVMYAEGDRVAVAQPMPDSGSQTAAAGGNAATGGGDESSQYVDLKGGLGPYDARQRAQDLEDEEGDGSRDSPAPAAFAILAGLLVAVAAARRRIG